MKILRITLTGEEPPHYTITNSFKKVFDQVDTIYWDEFTDIGQLNDILRARIRTIRYDAVFMQIQHSKIIHPETARILSEHSLVFNWTGDVRSDISWYIEIAPYVVTLFTNETDVKTIRGLGYRSDYLQTGYDHEYYFNTHRDRLNHIAYCANYYPEAGFPLTNYRINCVQALKTHFPEYFNLYGQKWDRITIKTDSDNADNQKEALLYNVTSLALSVSHFNYARYFSDRLLREMACGCCVLSHTYQDCEQDFEHEKNIVFFENIDDLIDKTKYYLKNPNRARQIGNNASELVTKEYRWDVVLNRFKQLIIKYK